MVAARASWSGALELGDRVVDAVGAQRGHLYRALAQLLLFDGVHLGAVYVRARDGRPLQACAVGPGCGIAEPHRPHCYGGRGWDSW